MRLRQNKKAISPLIASVLLIVVVVGIGAVVTGIVRNYITENKQTITEKTSDMKCGTEMQMEVPVVADAMRICKNTSYAASAHAVKFTLQNTGSATIDDMQLKVFGASGFVANDTAITESSGTTSAGNSIASGLVVGDTYEFTVPYANATVGTLQEIKIIPRVKVVGRTEKAYCTDSGLTFADLAECT